MKTLKELWEKGVVFEVFMDIICQAPILYP